MDKDRFKASLKLAEFSAGRWDARRATEWRFSLGLWALLAAAIHSFRVTSIPSFLPWLATALYIFWINNIWWSNYLDRMIMRAYREHCTALLNKDGVIYEDKHKPKIHAWLAMRPKLNRYVGMLADWSSLFQIVVTSLLIYLAYLFCQTSELSKAAG